MKKTLILLAYIFLIVGCKAQNNSKIVNANFIDSIFNMKTIDQDSWKSSGKKYFGKVYSFHMWDTYEKMENDNVNHKCHIPKFGKSPLNKERLFTEFIVYLYPKTNAYVWYQNLLKQGGYNDSLKRLDSFNNNKPKEQEIREKEFLKIIMKRDFKDFNVICEVYPKEGFELAPLEGEADDFKEHTVYNYKEGYTSKWYKMITQNKWEEIPIDKIGEYLKKLENAKVE